MRAHLKFHARGKACGLGPFKLPSVSAWAMLVTLVTLGGVGGAMAQDTGLQVFRSMAGVRVVQTAPAFLGQKIGRGECTDYVDLVLKHAVAQPGKNYVWGTEVTTIGAGDIIQFWNTKFTGPNGAAWGTNDKHTAIVLSVSGTRVTLIHQNFPSKSVVTKGDYDLGWPHTGTYKIYRPISQ